MAPESHAPYDRNFGEPSSEHPAHESQCRASRRCPIHGLTGGAVSASAPAELDGQRYFGFDEAASYAQSIGLRSATSWTLRRLVSAGRLKSLRLGRRIYLSKNALDEMLSRLERRAG